MDPGGQSAKERSGDSGPRAGRNGRLSRTGLHSRESRLSEHCQKDGRGAIVQMEGWVIECPTQTEGSEEANDRGRVGNPNKQRSPRSKQA